MDNPIKAIPLPLTVNDILDVIKKGIDVGELTVMGLKSLTPEILEMAIIEWQDPMIMNEYFQMDNFLIKFIAKPIFQRNWDRVEFILTDRWELYNRIAEDPEKKKLIDTERGKAWLNFVKRRCHAYYYEYAWGVPLPNNGDDIENWNQGEIPAPCKIPKH